MSDFEKQLREKLERSLELRDKLTTKREPTRAEIEQQNAIRRAKSEAFARKKTVAGDLAKIVREEVATTVDVFNNIGIKPNVVLPVSGTHEVLACKCSKCTDFSLLRFVGLGKKPLMSTKRNTGNFWLIDTTFKTVYGEPTPIYWSREITGFESGSCLAVDADTLVFDETGTITNLGNHYGGNISGAGKRSESGNNITDPSKTRDVLTLFGEVGFSVNPATDENISPLDSIVDDERPFANQPRLTFIRNRLLTIGDEIISATA